MDKEKILNYYCIDFILGIYFDFLEENKNLKSLINLNNINLDNLKNNNESNNKYKKIINYLINKKVIDNYFLEKIFDFHDNSKCIILKNIYIENEIILFSITKHNQNFFKNILLNKNRLKFLPMNLDCINKKNFEIFHGVYEELFENLFFKNFKEYILNFNKSLIINLVGKSINGMTNIILGYLINMVLENKINIYSYSICEFCNQDFDDIEKNNINLNIINHKYDALQLLVKPFTLNFKNLIILDKNSIFVQNNKDENQDTIINKNFIFNLFSYSLKYHSSIYFFDDLLYNTTKIR